MSFWSPNQAAAGHAFAPLVSSNNGYRSITITKPLKSGGSFVISATGMSLADIEMLISLTERLGISDKEQDYSSHQNALDAVGKPSGPVGDHS